MVRVRINREQRSKSRQPGSGWHRIITSSKERHLGRLVLFDLRLKSRQLRQPGWTLTRVLPSARTIRRLLLELGLRAQRPLWWIPQICKHLQYLSNNLKSSSGKRDAFDCAGIRVRIFRLLVDCSNQLTYTGVRHSLLNRKIS